MRRTTYLVLVASTLVAMAQCSDGIGPRTLENTVGVIVSAPVPVPLGAGRGAASADASNTGSTSVVYVSLPPGAVPGGVWATITNQATAQYVTTPVLGGGFDPVPLAASVGDTLAIDITGAAAAALAQVRLSVTPIRPLKVVRTSPPSGGRDVPLNSVMVIVFSEPVDPASVDSRSVQLWRDTTPVPGTVLVGGVYHTTAEFHPTDLLARLTAYRLTASPDIRNLSGQALGSPVDVRFTTGASVQAQAAAKLAFTVQPSSTTAGVAISPPVTVTIQDSLGNTVTNYTDLVNWRSSCVPASNCDSTFSGGSFVGVPVKAVNGVATFSDLQLFAAARGYTLVAFAVSGTLTPATSAPFDIAPGAPARLLVSVDHATVAQPFTAAVAIEDGAYNKIPSATNAVTLSLASGPPGATLAGTLTATAVSGVAHFTGLRVDPPGSYSLLATAGTLTGASNWFVAFAGGAFIQVTAGGTHTCGGTYAGVWYCWGLNDHGQLGDGTTTDRMSPVPVAGGQSFVAVSAGGAHTCGLTTAQLAYCWGLNDHGQLGDGTTIDRSSPVPVAGGISFTALSVGGAHTCGVTWKAGVTYDAGVTYCWGLNASGQLGDGTTTDRTTPQVVPKPQGRAVFSTAVIAGGNHTCGLDFGELEDFEYCWGSNANGQLGDGTTVGGTSPAAILGVPCQSPPPGFVPPTGGCSGFLALFAAVSPGGSHTCAEAGELFYSSFAWYCWGANGNGQLGDGTTTDRTSPGVVGGGRSFNSGSVSAGGSHTCGVAGIPIIEGNYLHEVPGDAYCWGLNSNGQLGDGTMTQRTSPALVAGGLSFQSVSAGGSHTCGVTLPGVYCWGKNDHGQLGTGTTTNSSMPVKVAGQP